MTFEKNKGLKKFVIVGEKIYKSGKVFFSFKVEDIGNLIIV